MTRFIFTSTGKSGRVLALFELIIIYSTFFLVEIASLYPKNGYFLSVELLRIENIIFPFTIVVLMLSLGLYNPRLRCDGDGIVRRLMVILVLMLLLSCVFQFISSSGVLSISNFYSPISISIFFVMGFRFIVSFIFEDSFKHKVLVLGIGKRAKIIEQRMRRESDKKGVDILGFVQVAGDNACVTAEKVITLNNGLAEYVDNHGVDEIVVACDERRGEMPIEELFTCKIQGVQVMDILNFIERETGQIAVNVAYPSWFIYSNGFNRSDSLRDFFSACLNHLLAILLLFFTWPLLIIVALLIYLEDRGPVFYHQNRVGFGGKPFKILKFRSMEVNAQKNTERWAQINDVRTTHIGHFIRRYHIDELPQIFNILRGEMSFIGPRPEQPEFVNRLCEVIPYYAERHKVKPGLTGWAQLKYPYGSSDNDAMEKLKYDLYYVKNRNLLFDLLIFIQTVEVVFFAQGSR